MIFSQFECSIPYVRQFLNQESLYLSLICLDREFEMNHLGDGLNLIGCICLIYNQVYSIYCKLNHIPT